MILWHSNRRTPAGGQSYIDSTGLASVARIIEPDEPTKAWFSPHANVCIAPGYSFSAGRERGYYADINDSGDAAFYVSPGLTIQLGMKESLFAFVRLPVYQRVNGLQLDLP